MAVYSRRAFSGSSNGRPVVIAATSTPGTLIHTAVAGSSDWDEIYLWVNNTHTAAVNLTIEYGGTTDPDHLILDAVPIPVATVPLWCMPVLILQNALEIRAFASSASKLLITGFVNRIS